MAHCLVTGATGFIGTHLVQLLTDQGHKVSCLVRPSSDRQALESFHPAFVVGDITEPKSLADALHDVDVVYHLAGVTKSVGSADFYRGNAEGVRNIAAACAAQDDAPTLVVVSSLAAAGPTRSGAAVTENDQLQPVSSYGQSKREGEIAAREFADRVPITIARPPIVLGEGDREGFKMFEGIATWRIHLVPGFADNHFSCIHADDLANALVLMAEKGRRLTTETDNTDGIYFASADEVLTYAELGRSIGEAVGRPRALIIRNPKVLVWVVAGVSELISRVRRKPHFLGLDKAREATAGSWACSSAKLREETGFTPEKPLRQRLLQTARWYFDQGWLRRPKSAAANDRSEVLSERSSAAEEVSARMTEKDAFTRDPS